MSCDNHLSEVRKDIILSLANHNMNESKVARELFMHRNTVVYNIKRIHQITGKDPMNFYDLHDLVRLVNEERRAEDGKL